MSMTVVLGLVAAIVLGIGRIVRWWNLPEVVEARNAKKKMMLEAKEKRKAEDAKKKAERDAEKAKRKEDKRPRR